MQRKGAAVDRDRDRSRIRGRCPLSSLEPAVLVAGRRVSIKIEPGGKTDWAPGELAKLVKDFRG